MNKDGGMKLVRCAVVEPVDGKYLKVGDEILVSDRRCKVLSTPPNPFPIKFCSVDGVLETLINRFHVYYKLICYDEYTACIHCGKEIVDGELCAECMMEYKQWDVVDEALESL